MRNVYGTYQNVKRVSETFFVKVSGTDPYIYIYIHTHVMVYGGLIYVYAYIMTC